MVHIRNLDLNLLVILDSLLEHRNVTRAAAALGLSQPAVSHALARLRETLGDPILLRAPSGMIPTPRGETLGPKVRAALKQVEGVLAAEETFDPARSEATVNIASNDYSGLTVLPAFCGRVARLAPKLRLQIVTQKERIPHEALAAGAIDLAFNVSTEDRPGLYARKLFQEDFVCLVRKDHPEIGKRLTLKAYLEHDHLLISPFGGMTGTVDEALEKIGLKRRVRISVPQFTLAPRLLAQTDLVLTLPRRIAEAATGDFRTFTPPVELAGFPFFALWNERTNGDPTHRWVRDQLFASL